MRAHPRLSRTSAAGLALLVGIALGGAPGEAGEPTDPQKLADESIAFFGSAAAPRLRLLIGPAEYAALQREPREYVKATLKENEKVVYADVGVKLKGGASFRPIDQKPDITVKVDKYDKKQQFHGLSKFHLNNSVQDPTLFCEFIGSEVFQAAGLPTVRVTHARVAINDRDLGLMVMLEAYDKPFVERNFADAKGNLYDTTGGDISGGAPKDVGKDKDDQDDILALEGACHEKDPVKRRELLEKSLNVDAFLGFMALERMLCDWDGYCVGRNNYRVYFPKDGRAVFMPHGLDNLLQDTNATILDEPTAMVAKAIYSDPQLMAAYRKKVIDLLPIFTHPEKIEKRLDAEARRTQAVTAGSGNPAQSGNVKGRFAARASNLVRQSTLPAPEPAAIEKGGALRLRVWVPQKDEGLPKLAQVNVGERVLRIQSAPDGSAGSWHSRVLLAPGKYRFEASVQTDGVVAAEGPPPGGAGLLASVAEGGPHLDGTTAWKKLEVAFVLAKDTNVDLALELRAKKGDATFKFGSLRVVRDD